MFAVLEIEGSNISTLFPTTALENVQLASICIHTYLLKLPACQINFTGPFI